ncbi:M4 family metallopeptidase [Chloroflexi bacterium TSY]|nr:M4 family metallopeptidase [Chloroflexi bacterium TSY]
MNKSPRQLITTVLLAGMFVFVIHLPASQVGHAQLPVEPAVDTYTFDEKLIDYKSISPVTGRANFVRLVTPSQPLWRLQQTPLNQTELVTRAQQFLTSARAQLGVGNSSSDLVLLSVNEDGAGNRHVTFQQVFRGIPVYAAFVRVHFTPNDDIKVVQSNFVPDLELPVTPRLDADQAADIALDQVLRGPSEFGHVTPRGFQVANKELIIYLPNLGRGLVSRSYLAYLIEVGVPEIHEQVFVGAQKGKILDRVSLTHPILDREIYHQSISSGVLLWQEGDAVPYTGEGATEVNWLIDYSEDTYNFFYTLSNGSFDSWDGAGATMQSIYDFRFGCPNAFGGSGITGFCIGVTSDDIISHEWAHNYTISTHNLIYQWQPGAINEAYSDIWGEIVDWLNGAGSDLPDTVRTTGSCSSLGGGPNPNDNSYRWLVGEDAAAFSAPLRDMWTPTCFGHPGKVSDTEYWCQEGDSGGVHVNSGVINHAFALLVDGGTYNGQTVSSIGLTKAAHIYWRAQTLYQMPATKFPDHADALEQACLDLIDQPLSALSTDSTTIVTSNDRIGSSDCLEVTDAIAAVEMRFEPTQCNFEPMFLPDPPPICSATEQSVEIFGTDWESGMGSWQVGTREVAKPRKLDTPNWTIASTLPDERAGSAAFVVNSIAYGDCAKDDESAVFYLQSPAIHIPQDSGSAHLTFEHWMTSEAKVDGGNVKIRVNDGSWTLVPDTSFMFNAYNNTLLSSIGGSANTNPLAGEKAFTGSDGGEVSGSWGQSQIDLTGFVSAGDTIELRFEMGQDGCGGGIGWYVDDVQVSQCVAMPTATPTQTSTPTATPSSTPTSTATPTQTQTLTPTETPTSASTPTSTPTPTSASIETPTHTATSTDTPATQSTETPTPVETMTPTVIVTNTPTETPRPTQTVTATKATHHSATPTGTPIHIPEMTKTPTVTSTPTATSNMTAVNPPTPTSTQTLTPTSTPLETITPIPKETIPSTDTKHLNMDVFLPLIQYDSEP